MGPVRIGVGTEWLLDGRAWRVVRQLAADRFIAQDVKFLLEQEFSQAELLARYMDGRLQFAVAGSTTPASKSPATTSSRAVELTARQKRFLKRRWQLLEPLLRNGHTPRQSEFEDRATEVRRQGVRCSARTLRRYYQTWLRAGKDQMALAPTNPGQRKRHRPRRGGLLEKHPPLGKLVEDAIHSVYLTKARRPISAVTRRVLEDLQRLNSRLPAELAVPIPRQATLARAIARRIGQLDAWEVDRQRWGRRIADRRHAPTSAQRLASRILQRVEIDHSPLKVVVGTEAGPIGQPWLTVIIDYYSRMVTGFCLGFEPPSYGVIMEALRHAILPKSYLAERYPRVQGSWPCFGLPETLVCDRGSDLTSKALEDAALQLGIHLDFNPPRTPHFKGTVESFFDGLGDGLASTLPGRTFRNWADRADYKPDDGPLLTYESLLEIIHIHLVDVYAASKHPTSNASRLEMWQESAALFPPSIPAAPDQLVVLLAKRVERTLSTRGIELGGMFYTSDELMALRAELATSNRQAERFSVRYNPWELGQLWVLHPINHHYVKATAIDTAMQGMTEYQWRVLKRAIRERFDEPEHLLSLAAGRNAIREVVEEALRKPSRGRRVRAARFLSKPSQQRVEPIDTSQVDNLSHPSPPDPTDQHTNVPPTEINPDDIDVDDWDVDST